MWERQERRLNLLWRGSRALGLHPWHPDVQKLSEHQLEWAYLQASEDFGGEPRKGRLQAKDEATEAAAMELIIWADQHISGR